MDTAPVPGTKQSGAGGGSPAAPGQAGGSSAPGSGPAPGGPAGQSPSPEAPAAPPSPARVQVIAKEYSFTLSRPEVPAGEVIVEFLNRGEDPHNLHLAQAAGGSEAGAFADTAPGVHADLQIELRPGSYTLFCSLPEHEAKGMRATLVVADPSGGGQPMKE